MGTPDRNEGHQTNTDPQSLVQKQLEERRERLRGVNSTEDDQAIRPSAAVRAEQAHETTSSVTTTTKTPPSDPTPNKERDMWPRRIYLILNILLFSSILAYFGEHPEAIPNFKVFASGNNIILVTPTLTEDEIVQTIVAETMAAIDATATTHAQIEATVAADKATIQAVYDATASAIPRTDTATPTSEPSPTPSATATQTPTRVPTEVYVTHDSMTETPSPTPTEHPLDDAEIIEDGLIILQESEPGAPIQWEWPDGVTVESLNLRGIYNTSGHPMTGFIPDGSAMAWTENGQIIYQIPTVRQQFMFTQNPDGTFLKGREVLRPDRKPTEYGTWEYAGVPTIFEINGQKYGMSHMESWAAPDNGSNFTAQIGLVKWDEKTVHWKLVGVMINGLHPLKAGEKISGAGQPSSFIKDGYLYTLFIDWNTGGADTLHAVRVPVEDIENPDAWKRWDGQGFNESAQYPQKSRPILFPRDGYASLPNVITNSETNEQYVVFETAGSFQIAKFDADTVTFSTPQVLLEFSRDKYGPGAIWFSYPSIVDRHAIQPQYFTTGNELSLIFSAGARGDTGHRPQSLEIIINS